MRKIAASISVKIHTFDITAWLDSKFHSYKSLQPVPYLFTAPIYTSQFQPENVLIPRPLANLHKLGLTIRG